MVTIAEIEELGWLKENATGFLSKHNPYVWFQKHTGTTREGLWRLKLEIDSFSKFDGRITIEQGSSWTRFFGFPNDKKELQAVMRMVGMNGIPKKNKYSKQKYDNYLKIVKDSIRKTKIEMGHLQKWEKIAEMSHEEWKEWQETGNSSYFIK